MNAFRAKRIANNLSNINAFRIRSHLYELQVGYRGQVASFDSESAFWHFVFKLAQASHEESTVAEVEARLCA